MTQSKIPLVGNFLSQELPHTPSAGRFHTSPNGMSSKQMLHDIFLLLLLLIFFFFHGSQISCLPSHVFAADLTTNSVQK